MLWRCTVCMVVHCMYGGVMCVRAVYCILWRCTVFLHVGRYIVC